MWKPSWYIKERQELWFRCLPKHSASNRQRRPARAIKSRWKPEYHVDVNQDMPEFLEWYFLASLDVGSYGSRGLCATLALWASQQAPRSQPPPPERRNEWDVGQLWSRQFFKELHRLGRWGCARSGTMRNKDALFCAGSQASLSGNKQERRHHKFKTAHKPVIIVHP